MSDSIRKIIEIVVRVTSQGLTATNKQLKELRNNVDTTKKSTDSLGKSYKSANKEAGDFNKTLKGSKNPIKNVGDETKKGGYYMSNFGKNIARATSIVATFSIAVGILQGAMRLIRLFTVDAALAAANFQEALLDLQAVANVSNADMQKLSDTILSVAGSTRFMAEEIAGLQKTLGRLGFTTDEIILSTEAVARFAEATGEDLNTAAEVTAKTLNAFGLEASSAFEVTNQLTTIINNTALSFNDLGTALQYPSSVANTLGVQLEETTALLGVLSNAGIRASRAGTGLRAIFTELGAEGGSLIPVLEDLAEEGLSLSEAEELVGRRFAGTLTVLVRQLDVVKDLTNAQKQLTSTFIASARQNSGFNAQVRILNAGIQSLLISLGDWITKTNILLSTIELITGDNTARGLSVFAQIGFTQEETDAAIKNLDEFKKAFDLESTITRQGENFQSFTIDVQKLQKELGIGADRAQELADQINAAVVEKGLFGFIKDAQTIKNFQAFGSVFDDLAAQVETFTKAEAKAIDETESLRAEVERFSNAIEAGTATDAEKDSLFERIGTQIEDTEDKLNRLIALGTDPQNFEYQFLQQLIEEYRRLLNLVTGEDIVPEDPIDLTEASDTLDTFESIAKKLVQIQDILAQPAGERDIPLLQRLQEELIAQEDLLRQSGLEDDFANFFEAFYAEAEEAEALDQALLDIVDSDAIIGTFRSLIEDLVDGIKDGRISIDQARATLAGSLEEFFILNDVPEYAQKLLREKILGLLPNEEDLQEGEKFFEQYGDLIRDKLADIARTANQVIFDATRRRIQSERALLDSRYDYERDRLESLVEANLITQEEYERKREQLAEERVRKENELAERQFKAEKARALADIAINTAVQISQALGNPIQIAIISAASAIQAGIVASQQFVPVRYEEGGLVQGKSHAEGGIPFSVQGVGGYEMEGGEYIVNKYATAKYLPQLEAINSFGKVGNGMFKHNQQGGFISGSNMDFNDALEVIANATLKTAQALDKPLRAYVSERELVRNTNAKLTTEKNSTL